MELRICEENGEWGDIRFFEVCLTDRNGVLKTDCDRKITVSVEGEGVLQGFGSALMTSTENFTQGEYTTFYGRAQLAVRPVGRGKIIVKAETDGTETLKKTF